jgi:ketosteroid isomerase-like protein
MNEHLNAAIVRSAYEAFANGDGAALAALLDDDITWHESTPGFEGDYHGRDQALALLGRVVQEMEEVKMFPVHDVLATDDHVVVLHELTATRNGRTLNGQYADVYHFRNGKATEHWHLAVDPKAEEAFWAS